MRACVLGTSSTSGETGASSSQVVPCQSGKKYTVPYVVYEKTWPCGDYPPDGKVSFNIVASECDGAPCDITLIDLRISRAWSESGARSIAVMAVPSARPLGHLPVGPVKPAAQPLGLGLSASDLADAAPHAAGARLSHSPSTPRVFMVTCVAVTP